MAIEAHPKQGRPSVAEEASADDACIAVAGDARMGEVYWGVFARENGTLRAIGEERVRVKAELETKGPLLDDGAAMITAATGIKVNYDVYDSNEILDAKLLAGRSGYDLVFPTATPWFARQIKAGPR